MKTSTALSRLLLASTTLFLASALAATPWTGTDDSDWANDGNWDGTAPGVTVGDTTADTATFGNAPDRTTVTVDADRLIHSLFFEGNNAPAYTFDGATLRLAAGGEIRRDGATGTGDITFENAILLQPETDTSSGTFTIAERAANSAFFFEGGITGGDTTGNLDLVLDGNSNFHVWFTGPINDGDAGSVSLVSNTLGAVTLDSTASNYSGGTFVNANTTFRLRESNVFGTGDITVSTGATMDMISVSRSPSPEDPALHSRLSFDNDIHLSGTLHSTNAGYFTDLTGDITLGGQVGADPRIGNTGRQTTLFGVISDATGFEGALGIVNGSVVFVNADNDFAGGIYNTGSGGAVSLRHDTSLGTGPILINSDPNGVNIDYGLTFTTPLETNFNGGAAVDYRTRVLDNDLILNGRIFLTNPNTMTYTFNGDVTLGTVATAQPKFEGRYFGDTITINSEITDGGFDHTVTQRYGTLVLTQNNSLANNFVLESGPNATFRTRLWVGNGGATGLVGTGEIQMGNNAELRFNRTGTYTVENTITGTGNFFVEGGGTATLDQANTYTGTTSVTGASTLLVDGSHTGGGNYTIAAGSTLGGAGSIGVGDNSITLSAGSFLAPGSPAAAGTLNVSMTASGVMDLSAIAEFGTENFIFRLGSVSDSVAVTGGLVNFGFNNLGWTDFDFILGSGFGPGTYTLFSSDGGLFGSLDATATEGVLNGFDSFLTFDANALTLTVIPEPATVAGILGALALGLALWRRQSRRFNQPSLS